MYSHHMEYHETVDEKISDVGNNNFGKTLTFKLQPFCKGTKFDTLSIFAHPG